MTPTFEIDIFHPGFDYVCQAVAAAVERTQVQVGLVGSIPTKHYFENLARHLPVA